MSPKMKVIYWVGIGFALLSILYFMSDGGPSGRPMYVIYQQPAPTYTFQPYNPPNHFPGYTCPAGYFNAGTGWCYP